MALTGHLSDLSLCELIEFFCNQRKTGQLRVLYPEGYGQFYIQAGSVVDARIGVLRGIDAVYFALTLPNARFEFGGTEEVVERTINQPWTQVVLEGLRRLDEGIVPSTAFPPDYSPEGTASPTTQQETSVDDPESLRVPGFLSSEGHEATGRRKAMIAGAVAVAIIASVAVLGVPAGWFSRNGTAAVVNQPVSQASSTAAPATESMAPVVEELNEAPVTSEDTPNDAAMAAKRLRDRERLRAREERAAAETQVPPSPTSSVPATAVTSPGKAGLKKIVVTVSYDETGRVTQASGGDASAVRIARQKRFPAGKAGSATVTIPIN